MINVLTHGKRYSTEEEIRNNPVPILDWAGRAWKPIHHWDLISAICNDAEARGWTVADKRFCLEDKGNDIVGAIGLLLPDIILEGQTLGIGIISSNVQKVRAKLYVGSTVTICSNGFVTGELVLAKKHTVNLDLSASVHEALDGYVMKAKSIQTLTYKLQDTTLTDTQTEHILMEAGRRGQMPWSRIGDVDREYRKPTFGEEAFKRGTAWGLLNAFTHIVKKNPPRDQMWQINGFRQLVESVAA